MPVLTRHQKPRHGLRLGREEEDTSIEVSKQAHRQRRLDRSLSNSASGINKPVGVEQHATVCAITVEAIDDVAECRAQGSISRSGAVSGECGTTRTARPSGTGSEDDATDDSSGRRPTDSGRCCAPGHGVG
jgi:hypothetical protein